MYHEGDLDDGEIESDTSSRGRREFAGIQGYRKGRKSDIWFYRGAIPSLLVKPPPTPVAAACRNQQRRRRCPYPVSVRNRAI